MQQHYKTLLYCLPFISWVLFSEGKGDPHYTVQPSIFTKILSLKGHKVQKELGEPYEKSYSYQVPGKNSRSQQDPKRFSTVVPWYRHALTSLGHKFLDPTLNLLDQKPRRGGGSHLGLCYTLQFENQDSQ